jgi:hypothetical protein
MNILINCLVGAFVAMPSWVSGDEFSPKEMKRPTIEELSRLIDPNTVDGLRFVGSLKGNVETQRKSENGHKIEVWDVRTARFPNLRLLARNEGEFESFLDIRKNDDSSIFLSKSIRVHAVHQFPEGAILAIGGMAHLDEWRGKLLVLDDISKKIGLRVEFDIKDGFPVYIGSGKFGVRKVADVAVVAVVKGDRLRAIVLVGSEGVVGLDLTGQLLGGDKVDNLLHWSLSDGDE